MCQEHRCLQAQHDWSDYPQEEQQPPSKLPVKLMVKQLLGSFHSPPGQAAETIFKPFRQKSDWVYRRAIF
jgi:hypothetical protein